MVVLDIFLEEISIYKEKAAPSEGAARNYIAPVKMRARCIIVMRMGRVQ